MSHQITNTDRVVLNRKSAWHGLGKVIEEDLSCEAAARKYELAEPVEGMPVFIKHPTTGELVEIETHQANVRMINTPEGDIASVLGVVGSSYQICQNIDLARFMDALANESHGDVVTETCGTLQGGKRVWFLARGGSYDIGGDKSYQYLLGSNSHGGDASIRFDPTDIRVVCANTWQAVTGSFREPENLRRAGFSVRHSGNLEVKLEECRRALREFGAASRSSRELAERLADTAIDRRGAVSFFSSQYAASGFALPTEENLPKSTRDKRQRAMDKAYGAFMARYDSECAKFGGESAWLALNAWTGYVQHDKASAGADDTARRENRIRSSLFGVNRDRTTDATVNAVAQFLSA